MTETIITTRHASEANRAARRAERFALSARTADTLQEKRIAAVKAVAMAAIAARAANHAAENAHSAGEKLWSMAYDIDISTPEREAARKALLHAADADSAAAEANAAAAAASAKAAAAAAASAVSEVRFREYEDDYEKDFDYERDVAPRLAPDEGKHKLAGIIANPATANYERRFGKHVGELCNVNHVGNTYSIGSWVGDIYGDADRGYTAVYTHAELQTICGSVDTDTHFERVYGYTTCKECGRLEVERFYDYQKLYD
jgi:hypothetical protein